MLVIRGFREGEFFCGKKVRNSYLKIFLPAQTFCGRGSKKSSARVGVAETEHTLFPKAGAKRIFPRAARIRRFLWISAVAVREMRKSFMRFAKSVIIVKKCAAAG